MVGNNFEKDYFEFENRKIGYSSLCYKPIKGESF